MCITKFLVLLDTDRIKDYVFATNKLREIRGASAILDELNLESTYQVLDYVFGEGNYDKVDGEWKHNCKTIKVNNIDWEVMFLGGGSGKILFAEDERARKFCQTIQEKYREETDNAASITAVCVSRLDCEDFQHLIVDFSIGGYNKAFVGDDYLFSVLSCNLAPCLLNEQLCGSKIPRTQFKFPKSRCAPAGNIA